MNRTKKLARSYTWWPNIDIDNSFIDNSFIDNSFIDNSFIDNSFIDIKETIRMRNDCQYASNKPKQNFNHPEHTVRVGERVQIDFAGYVDKKKYVNTCVGRTQENELSCLRYIHNVITLCIKLASYRYE